MDVMQSMAVFRRVVEAGSFSAVARELGMSQSSASKHVAALEERLGAKLLNRSTRQLNMTDAGTKYYHYCVRILNDFQEAEASVGKGRIKPTGTLRLSSTAPFGKSTIIPALMDFLEDYPDIDIDYTMEERTIDLVKEGIDLAIRVGPLADSSLIAKKIGQTSRLVVASPEYLMKHGFPKKPSDLESHQCLLYSSPNISNEWFFTSQQYGDESVLVNGRFKSSSNEAIREAAISGLGVATLCERHARDYVKQGQLTVLMKKYELSPFDIHAVYPERRYVPQKVKRLIDHLETCFSDNN